MTALRLSAAGFVAGFAMMSSAMAAPMPVQVLPQVQSDIVQVQFKTVCRKVAIGYCGPGVARCKTQRVCTQVPINAPRAPTGVRVL